MGDRIGVLADLDIGSVVFFKNGVKHGPGWGAGSVAGPVVLAMQVDRHGSSGRILVDVARPIGQEIGRAQKKLSDGEESPGVVNFGKANLVAPPPKEVKKVDTGLYCEILNKTGGATGGVNSGYAQRIAYLNTKQMGYMKHNPQEDAKQMVVNPSGE
jgi:hypothetical protein